MNELKVLRRIEFIAQQGVGLANVPASTTGVDPALMVRFSRDGGMTWGMEHQCSLGKSGEYFNRAFLTQLGVGRNWVVEVAISDPVFCALINCTVELEPGTF